MNEAGTERSLEAAAGLTIFITAASPAVGVPLAAALAGTGHRVALLGDAASGGPHGAVHLPLSLRSRDALARGFAQAEERLGRAELIIHDAMPAMPAATRRVVDLSYAEWSQLTHRTVTAALYCLQAAAAHFAGRVGSVLMLGPAMALVGAPGLVPLTAALEAQRSLMKSAARQWGKNALRLNWLALADTSYPQLAAASIPAVPELGPPPPAFGRAPDLKGEIASLVAFFGSAASSALTGATLNADGGNWMVP
jgi:NAD(P)-dependent dehydrogenase (short-subunit alcohol dehydrogenase family)